MSLKTKDVVDLDEALWKLWADIIFFNCIASVIHF
jgi:hypothetical protein